VLDALALESPPVVHALLAEFVRDSRRARAEAITLLHLGAPSLLTRRLRSFGFFRLQEEIGAFVLVEDGSAHGAKLRDPRRWHLLGGDVDL